jgi:hypothetical protein
MLISGAGLPVEYTKIFGKSPSGEGTDTHTWSAANTQNGGNPVFCLVWKDIWGLSSLKIDGNDMDILVQQASGAGEFNHALIATYDGTFPTDVNIVATFVFSISHSHATLIDVENLKSLTAVNSQSNTAVSATRTLPNVTGQEGGAIFCCAVNDTQGTGFSSHTGGLTELTDVTTGVGGIRAGAFALQGEASANVGATSAANEHTWVGVTMR